MGRPDQPAGQRSGEIMDVERAEISDRRGTVRACVFTYTLASVFTPRLPGT